jgi:hypothetical protein
MEGGFVGGLALDFDPKLKPGKTIDESTTHRCKSCSAT